MHIEGLTSSSVAEELLRSCDFIQKGKFPTCGVLVQLDNESIVALSPMPPATTFTRRSKGTANQ